MDAGGARDERADASAKSRGLGVQHFSSVRKMQEKPCQIRACSISAANKKGLSKKFKAPIGPSFKLATDVCFLPNSGAEADMPTGPGIGPEAVIRSPRRHKRTLLIRATPLSEAPQSTASHVIV